MAKAGPIVLVEDDQDDKEVLEEILKELHINNTISWFTNSIDAFQYLKNTVDRPFIIFCDVNLPRQNGIDFKRSIDSNAELRRKSIPFVFYSTSVSQAIVNEAYTQMTVQGFFKKGNNYNIIKDMVDVIIKYWRFCEHPNA